MFAKSYGFQHVPSSPRYPQSNGLAERTVKTVKKLISLSPDPEMALLTYHATPLPWCGRSPAELLMGRRLRTTLPQTNDQLIPKWTYLPNVQDSHTRFKEKQKEVFDHRHRVREQPPVSEDTEVWVTSGNKPQRGRVVSQAGTPRSYLVETSSGTLRRNRLHLNIVPEREQPERSSTDCAADLGDSPPRRIRTRTQTGASILPLLRFRDQENST